MPPGSAAGSAGLGGSTADTGFDAEGWLSALEETGWRFGLDRINKLLTVLGMPQRRYASIHVVGTNGKSSVTAFTAALLERAGSPYRRVPVSASRADGPSAFVWGEPRSRPMTSPRRWNASPYRSRQSSAACEDG